MVNASHIFYVLGIIFLFVTISYFSYEYLFDLPNIVKAVIIGCLALIFFVFADFMAEKDI